MTAAAHLTGSWREAFGLPISTLRWKDCLSLMDTAVDIRVGCRAVSFLTGRMLARTLVDRRYRETLRERILLPANRRTAFLIGFAAPGRTPSSCDPVRFVPSLLSYMSSPRRIVLLGPDKARLAAAKAQLQAHAPWHSLSAILLTETVCGRRPTMTDAILDAAEPDVVIVDSSDPGDEERTERYLTFRHDGLVVLTRDYFDAALVMPAPQPAPSHVAKLTICSPKKFNLS